jgi:hypothetical protein
MITNSKNTDGILGAGDEFNVMSFLRNGNILADCMK